MKKLLLLLALIAMTSCVVKEEPKKDNFLDLPIVDQPKERIKLVDEQHLGSRTFYILEVDGHLYLSQYYGGFVHLESCPCKNKLK